MRAQCVRIMILKKSLLARATPFLNAAAKHKDQWATGTTKNECHLKRATKT